MTVSDEKSPESLIYDQAFCMTGLSWQSRNCDTFSVGVPPLEMTDLPDTILRQLRTLGNSYTFPKLVTFLYSKEKYLIFFLKLHLFFVSF